MVWDEDLFIQDAVLAEGIPRICFPTYGKYLTRSIELGPPEEQSLRGNRLCARAFST